MKIVPWIIIIFMIYVVYYFISRAEKRISALEKHLNKVEGDYAELKKDVDQNRLLIEENHAPEPQNDESVYED